jgi:hypothetical protein
MTESLRAGRRTNRRPRRDSVASVDISNRRSVAVSPRDYASGSSAGARVGRVDDSTVRHPLAPAGTGVSPDRSFVGHRRMLSRPGRTATWVQHFRRSRSRIPTLLCTKVIVGTCLSGRTECSRCATASAGVSVRDQTRSMGVAATDPPRTYSDP